MLTQEQYRTESIRNFARDLRALMTLEYTMTQVNKAREIADKQWGYDAPYGDPGYVGYDKREPAYLALTRQLDSACDGLSDDHITLTHSVIHALSFLNYEGLNAVIKAFEDGAREQGLVAKPDPVGVYNPARHA